MLKCVYTVRHPESHRDYDRHRYWKLIQNPEMGICVEVCLCAVWPPPHNSIQPISYQSLYRSRWLAVWKHHKSGSVTLWKEILKRDTAARDKVFQTNLMLFLYRVQNSGPLTAQKQFSSLVYMQDLISHLSNSIYTTRPVTRCFVKYHMHQELLTVEK